MKLYLAGPLFTQAEQNWLRALKSEIEVCAKDLGRAVDVVWPGELVSPEDIEKWGRTRSMKFSRFVKNTSVRRMYWSLFWTGLWWMMAPPGRSAIFTPSGSLTSPSTEYAPTSEVQAMFPARRST